MLSNKRIVIEPQQTSVENSYTRNGKMLYRKSQNNTTWPTESFLNTLKFTSTLLPKNTRYHRSYMSGKRHIFITEHEPTMRTITVEKNHYKKWETFNNWCERKNITDGQQHFEGRRVINSYRKYTFQILVPYIVAYTMLIPEANDWTFQIFMRKSPLSSFDDVLHKVPFYNIQRSQSVCMSFDRVDVFKMNISEIVDRMYAIFWMSTFNTDYNYNIISYRYRQIFNNYFIWEYESKNHPEQIFNTKYIAYQSLGTFLQDKDYMYKDKNNTQFYNLLSFFK